MIKSVQIFENSPRAYENPRSLTINTLDSLKIMATVLIFTLEACDSTFATVLRGWVISRRPRKWAIHDAYKIDDSRTLLIIVKRFIICSKNIHKRTIMENHVPFWYIWFKLSLSWNYQFRKTDRINLCRSERVYNYHA